MKSREEFIYISRIFFFLFGFRFYFATFCFILLHSILFVCNPFPIWLLCNCKAKEWDENVHYNSYIHLHLDLYLNLHLNIDKSIANPFTHSLVPRHSRQWHGKTISECHQYAQQNNFNAFNFTGWLTPICRNFNLQLDFCQFVMAGTMFVLYVGISSICLALPLPPKCHSIFISIIHAAATQPIQFQFI